MRTCVFTASRTAPFSSILEGEGDDLPSRQPGSPWPTWSTCQVIRDIRLLRLNWFKFFERSSTLTTLVQ